MKWSGMLWDRGAQRVLVRKPKGKRPLGWPRHRWEDNSKTDLQWVGWKGMHWTDLPQDSDRWWALVNVVMNLQVPQNAESFSARWGFINFSRMIPFNGVSWSVHWLVTNLKPLHNGQQLANESQVHSDIKCVQTECSSECSDVKTYLICLTEL